MELTADHLAGADPAFIHQVALVPLSAPEAMAHDPKVGFEQAGARLAPAMHVLDHVSISVPDVAAVRPFYDAVMGALGVAKVYDRPDALGYGVRCDADDDSRSYLAVYQSRLASADPGRHWCFKAGTRAQVREFHARGLAHGGRDDGPPGLRAQYHPHYYGAFLLDPIGNRVEAVCHRAEEG